MCVCVCVCVYTDKKSGGGKENDKHGKILKTGESRERVYRYSLYYFLNINFK